MRRRQAWVGAIGVLWLTAAGVSLARPSKKHPQTAQGIHVGPPKVYDNRSLELMLQAAQARLAKLQFLDQTKVASNVGALQGGTSQQSAFSVQATGLPTAQIATKQISSTQPSGPTTSNEVDTTRASVSPSIPALPTGGAPALPSSFSPSALDTLNEEMQLTYEVTNLQLLLQGSLNDRFISPVRCLDNCKLKCENNPQKDACIADCSKNCTTLDPELVRQMKRPATIGFPISIEVPKDSKYDNAVAEIIVTVKTSTDHRTADEAPGLMTILPREKTYNEATIRDKSSSFGLAAVTHVFSVGVAGSKHTQTFYIVQDLDTVAFIRETNNPAACGNDCTTIFGWQFRPTLGRKKLRSGLRQTFVQLSFPIDTPNLAKVLGTVKVEAHWLKYDAKTGGVGEPIYVGKGDTDGPVTLIPENTPLPNFDLKPRAPFIDWADAGNGQVYVEALEDYLRGSSVTAGATVWNNGTPGFTQDSNGIHFVAPAAALMTSEDAYVVGPGGERTRLTHLADTTSINLRITAARAAAWSGTDSQITVSYSGAATGSVPNPRFQPLVKIGDKVFGLSDLPVKLDDPSCLTVGKCTITFRAPTDLVRRARVLKVKQLFYGLHAQDIAAIDIANEFTATKLVIVAKTNECTLYAIQGSGLNVDSNDPTKNVQVLIDQALLEGYDPQTSCEFNAPDQTTPLMNSAERAKQEAENCDESLAYVDGSFGPATLLVAAPNCLVSRAKAVELRRGDPNNPKEVQSVFLPIEPEPTAKPQLEDIRVKIGDTSFKLMGKHLELISLDGIAYNGMKLAAQIARDGSYIMVQLPPALAQTPGFYAITLKLTDGKTTIGGLVQVVKPDNPSP